MLTPNDKAAHYLGWKPGILCGNATGQFPCQHDYWHVREIECPAPDMRQPANYMKALEEIANKMGPYSYISFAPPTDDGGSKDCCIYFFLNGWCPANTMSCNGTGGTFGEAAMYALAALYDAEHPEAAEATA